MYPSKDVLAIVDLLVEQWDLVRLIEALRLGVPSTAEEWMAMLLRLSLSLVHDGIEEERARPNERAGDEIARPFYAASDLLDGVARLDALGVRLPEHTSVFPDALASWVLQPVGQAGGTTFEEALNLLGEAERKAEREARTWRVIAPLFEEFGREFVVYRHLEGLPIPTTAAEWLAWLVNDAVLVIDNASRGQSGSEQPSNAPLFIMASREVRCIAMLYEQGVRPSERIPL